MYGRMDVRLPRDGEPKTIIQSSPHFLLQYELACAHIKKELCDRLIGDDITRG